MQIHRILPLLLAAAMPAWADPPPCLAEEQQLRQTLVQHPPIDPATMNEVLRMRHEGMSLCHGGAAADGQAKLQAALDKARPHGLPSGSVPPAHP